MKLLKGFFVLFLSATTFMACMPFHSTGVCDNPETYEQSWLCHVAKSQSLQLEDFDDIIIDAETLALITDTVEAEAVIEWVHKIQAFVKASDVLTYSELLTEIRTDAKARLLYQRLSKRLYLFESANLIQPVDRSFLLYALDNIEVQAQMFINMEKD